MRMARMMTIHDLAEKSGVADRTIADIERGTSRARPETIRCIAKALGVSPEGLLATDATSPATRDVAREPTHEPTHAPTASTEAAPVDPPHPRSAIPSPKLHARTRLDALADLQRAQKIAPPPVAVGNTKARVDVLTPVRMQDLFARHAAFDGARFVVDGNVDQQRALSAAEARALGAKVGVGARYHVIAEIVPGEPLGVTVHATDAKLAGALQAKVGESVRVVVTVRVVGKNDARVVSLFASARKRAWAFVAERMC